MPEPTLIPYPQLPPSSIERRLRHFPASVYRSDSSTLVYKLVAAMAGDSGAGDLKKILTVSRLSNQIDSLYFSDLDRLFGNALGFHRLSSESYSFDINRDMLTADEWDVVRIKDSQYKQRCKKLLEAIGYGGTPRGFKMAVEAAVGSSCDIYETWKYVDNLGMASNLGRTGVTLRNEIVIRPWNTSLTISDQHLIVRVLERFKPVDTVLTVNVNGLAVNEPMVYRGVSSDSTYFEVQKHITGSTDIGAVAQSEYLLNDLRESEKWLTTGVAVTAPTAAFNSTQESSLYYFASTVPGGSFVDRVTYETERNGVRASESAFKADLSAPATFTGWRNFDLADSPDNYPGGKFGQTPDAAPALSQNGGAYVFQWNSQSDYETYATSIVTQNGGQVQDGKYRLPLSSSVPALRTYLPIEAVPTEAPQRDSTVTTGWLSRTADVEYGDPGL